MFSSASGYQNLMLTHLSKVEAYLRSNLLTMIELLGETRAPIENVIECRGPNASEILRLQMRKPG